MYKYNITQDVLENIHPGKVFRDENNGSLKFSNPVLKETIPYPSPPCGKDACEAIETFLNQPLRTPYIKEFKLFGKTLTVIWQ